MEGICAGNQQVIVAAGDAETRDAALISAMNDDIKAQDERYTQMAESFINSDAKAA